MKAYLFSFMILSALLTATGCRLTPSGVTPVQNFDADRYLGLWYSIARFDHRFERGLTHVTAEYTRKSENRIRVLNRGWDPERGEWGEAEASATFPRGPEVGLLRVTFFWPFSGGYNVIALDEDYQWAMVSGPNRNYLWILSRTPTLDEEIIAMLTAKADEMGFAVENLERVPQIPPIEEPAVASR